MKRPRQSWRPVCLRCVPTHLHVSEAVSWWRCEKKTILLGSRDEKLVHRDLKWQQHTSLVRDHLAPLQFILYIRPLVGRIHLLLCIILLWELCSSTSEIFYWRKNCICTSLLLTQNVFNLTKLWFSVTKVNLDNTHHQYVTDKLRLTVNSLWKVNKSYKHYFSWY